MTVTVTDPDFNFSELDWKSLRYKRFSDTSWVSPRRHRAIAEVLVWTVRGFVAHVHEFKCSRRNSVGKSTHCCEREMIHQPAPVRSICSLKEIMAGEPKIGGRCVFAPGFTGFLSQSPAWKAFV